MAFLFALFSLYLFFVLFSPITASILHPDELNGFVAFSSEGWIGGIYAFWKSAMGRYSALAWFGIPFSLADFFGIWPWYAVVGARVIGFLISLGCFYLLIRELFPGGPNGIHLPAAAVLSAIPIAQTKLLTDYQWFDQAIYLLSFYFLCLTLLFFWRLAKRRTVGSVGWFALVFFIFLGAHEINLVTGGLMLGVFLLLILAPIRRRLPEVSFGEFVGRLIKIAPFPRITVQRANGPWRLGIEATPEPRHSRIKLQLGHHRISLRKILRTEAERLHSLLLILSLTFVGSAVIQLTSPSLANRSAGWPPVRTWSESVGVGIVAGLEPLYDLALGFRGALLPIFVGGFIWGLWWYRGERITRRTSLLLLLPLALAFISSLLTAILAARTGVLVETVPAAKEELRAFFDPPFQFMPIRQSLFAHQFFTIAALCLGLFVSQFFAWERVARSGLPMRVAVGLSLSLWLVYAVVASPVFAQARSFDALAKLVDVTRLYTTLERNPGFDGTVYMEWPHRPSTGYRRDKALARIFETSGPVQFVPCGIASADAACGDTLEEFVLDTRVARIGDIWSRGINGTRRAEDGAVFFAEDETRAEHFLESIPLEKATASIIDVSVDVGVANYRDARNLLMYLISQDGTVLVEYNLRNQTIARTEHDARALSAAIEDIGDGIVRLSAYFFIEGPAEVFNLRIQGVDRAKTIYTGNTALGFQVTDAKIRVLSGS